MPSYARLELEFVQNMHLCFAPEMNCNERNCTVGILVSWLGDTEAYPKGKEIEIAGRRLTSFAGPQSKCQSKRWCEVQYDDGRQSEGHPPNASGRLTGRPLTGTLSLGDGPKLQLASEPLRWATVARPLDVNLGEPNDRGGSQVHHPNEMASHSVWAGLN